MKDEFQRFNGMVDFPKDGSEVVGKAQMACNELWRDASLTYTWCVEVDNWAAQWMEAHGDTTVTVGYLDEMENSIDINQSRDQTLRPEEGKQLMLAWGYERRQRQRDDVPYWSNKELVLGNLTGGLVDKRFSSKDWRDRVRNVHVLGVGAFGDGNLGLMETYVDLLRGRLGIVVEPPSRANPDGSAIWRALEAGVYDLVPGNEDLISDALDTQVAISRISELNGIKDMGIAAVVGIGNLKMLIAQRLETEKDPNFSASVFKQALREELKQWAATADSRFEDVFGIFGGLNKKTIDLVVRSGLPVEYAEVAQISNQFPLRRKFVDFQLVGKSPEYAGEKAWYDSGRVPEGLSQTESEGINEALLGVKPMTRQADYWATDPAVDRRIFEADIERERKRLAMETGEVWKKRKFMFKTSELGLRWAGYALHPEEFDNYDFGSVVDFHDLDKNWEKEATTGLTRLGGARDSYLQEVVDGEGGVLWAVHTIRNDIWPSSPLAARIAEIMPDIYKNEPQRMIHQQRDFLARLSQVPTRMPMPGGDRYVLQANSVVSNLLREVHILPDEFRLGELRCLIGVNDEERDIIEARLQPGNRERIRYVDSQLPRDQEWWLNLLIMKLVERSCYAAIRRDDVEEGEGVESGVVVRRSAHLARAGVIKDGVGRIVRYKKYTDDAVNHYNADMRRLYGEDPFIALPAVNQTMKSRLENRDYSQGWWTWRRAVTEEGDEAVEIQLPDLGEFLGRSLY